MLRDEVVGSFTREGPITREPPRKGINFDFGVWCEGAQDVKLDVISKIEWEFIRFQSPFL